MKWVRFAETYIGPELRTAASRAEALAKADCLAFDLSFVALAKEETSSLLYAGLPTARFISTESLPDSLRLLTCCPFVITPPILPQAPNTRASALEGLGALEAFLPKACKHRRFRG
jgi:hypothetical protein